MMRNLINIINEADTSADPVTSASPTKTSIDASTDTKTTPKTRKGQLLLNILKKGGSIIARNPKTALLLPAAVGGISWFLSGDDAAERPAKQPPKQSQTTSTAQPSPSAAPAPTIPEPQTDQSGYPADQPAKQAPQPAKQDAPCKASPEMTRIADEAALLLDQAAKFNDARVRNEMEKLDMFLASVPCLNWKAASWLR